MLLEFSFLGATPASFYSQHPIMFSFSIIPLYLWPLTHHSFYSLYFVYLYSFVPIFSSVLMAPFSHKHRVPRRNRSDVWLSQNSFGMCNYWKLLLGKVLISICGRSNYTFSFSVAMRCCHGWQEKGVWGACFGGEASSIDVLNGS